MNKNCPLLCVGVIVLSLLKEYSVFSEASSYQWFLGYCEIFELFAFLLQGREVSRFHFMVSGQQAGGVVQVGLVLLMMMVQVLLGFEKEN